MATLVSVNAGTGTPIGTRTRPSGIDKRPVDGAVRLAAPGPKGRGSSGVSGDVVVDRRHHGGDDQAVYAYAREDLDWWQADIGRPLAGGVFGENLTTAGLDVNGAVIGERWRVGDAVELVVTTPRIPCRTFSTWMAVPRWKARFTAAARPGAYLRVAVPGEVQAGDEILVVDRPDHPITVAVMFRALTDEPELLPSLVAAGAHLVAELRGVTG
jgi:MOSC domain-containing protein YiiM